MRPRTKGRTRVEIHGEVWSSESAARSQYSRIKMLTIKCWVKLMARIPLFSSRLRYRDVPFAGFRVESASVEREALRVFLISSEEMKFHLNNSESREERTREIQREYF